MKSLEGFSMKSKVLWTFCAVLFLGLFLSLLGCGGSDSTGGRVVKYQHPDALAKVQEAIQREGAQWIADETSVSESFEDIQDAQIMAGDEDPDEDPEPGFLAGGATPKPASRKENARNVPDSEVNEAASAFSWRNKDDKDWTTDAKDQGHYGTCIAFAMIGAFEIQIRIAKNNPAIAIDLSEWCLWYEGTSGDNPNPGGWDEIQAAKRLKEKGTVSQKACPYTPEKYPTFTQIDAGEKRYRIQSYSWVNGVDEMKKALQKGPLVGSMTVFPYFDNFYKGGVYSQVYTYDPAIDIYRDKAGNPAKGTLHAILIIGYDDNQGCWICKNSSGTGWGDNGYCLIKYGLTGGIASQALQLSVDSSIDLD